MSSLREKIEDAGQAIVRESLQMSELLELIGGMRATAGRRDELARYLERYRVKHTPVELPNVGTDLVTIYREEPISPKMSHIAGQPSLSGREYYKNVQIESEYIILKISKAWFEQNQDKKLLDVIGAI